MKNGGQEIEAKFYVKNLSSIERRLQAVGGELVSPRVKEINLRFDTPDGRLSISRQALRLRMDTVARLTFKGPQAAGETVSNRQEIEFEVSDYQAARQFLEALGFILAVSYEKYRTTYALGSTEVVLDELPFGSFIEIEASSADEIFQIARRLGLDWDARCAESYLGLFLRLKAAVGLQTENLTFTELTDWQGDLTAIGLKFSDQAG